MAIIHLDNHMVQDHKMCDDPVLKNVLRGLNFIVQVGGTRR